MTLKKWMSQCYNQGNRQIYLKGVHVNDYRIKSCERRLDDSKPHEDWKLKKDAPEWERIEFAEWLEINCKYKIQKKIAYAMKLILYIVVDKLCYNYYIRYFKSLGEGHVLSWDKQRQCKGYSWDTKMQPSEGDNHWLGDGYYFYVDAEYAFSILVICQEVFEKRF